MAPKLKANGQVIQENESVLGSDEAAVGAETGPVLRIVFVDGKNPETREVAVENIGSAVSDPAGPSA